MFPPGQEGAWDPPDLSHAVLSRLELWETIPDNSQVVPRYTGVIRLFPQAHSTQAHCLHGQVFAQPCLAAQSDGGLAWHCQCSAAEVFSPVTNSAPSQVLLYWAGREGACFPLVWGQLLPPSLLFPQVNLFLFQFVKRKISCYFNCSWTPTVYQ